MVSGKYSALAGAISREQAIANISENLANVSTTGYKRTSMSFESLLRGEQQRTSADGINYTRVAENSTDFSPGPLIDTDNPLDIAIHGEGFFKVLGPDGPLLTRRGDLRIGADELLQTRSGLPVLDANGAEITVPVGAGGRISINAHGVISIINDDGTAVDAGQVGVVTVNDTKLLKKEEHTTFSLMDGGEEVPMLEPDIVVGSLEGSNVNMISEMTKLIANYRTFETNHSVLKAYSDISDKQSELGTLS